MNPFTGHLGNALLIVDELSRAAARFTFGLLAGVFWIAGLSIPLVAVFIAVLTHRPYRSVVAEKNVLLRNLINACLGRSEATQ